MKVLFLGEYSGVFTELSKALDSFGIETYKISNGDGYKNYPTDFYIERKGPKNSFELFLVRISYRLGIMGLMDFVRVWSKLKQKLDGYDVVQINNPRFLPYGYLINNYILRYVLKHNKNMFMSVLGDDYYVNKWYIQSDTKMPMYKKHKYKILSRELFFGKYVTDYALKKAKAIIPGTYVYKLSYEWCGNTTPIIPFPCDERLIGYPFKIKEGEPIRIFHGWQKGKEERKGNDVFDRVIKKVVLKYGSKVEYQIVQGVPFDEYKKMFASCHIYIDQLYAHDKATSGMYGMAAGKVVFAGFETSSLLEYPCYNGEEIGISSSLNENELFRQFCDLIDNPRRMEKISENAIRFIRDNHAASKVAKMYLQVWNTFCDM